MICHELIILVLSEMDQAFVVMFDKVMITPLLEKNIQQDISPFGPIYGLSLVNQEHFEPILPHSLSCTPNN